jgi:hypothetical protein
MILSTDVFYSPFGLESYRQPQTLLILLQLLEDDPRIHVHTDTTPQIVHTRTEPQVVGHTGMGTQTRSQKSLSILTQNHESLARTEPQVFSQKSLAVLEQSHESHTEPQTQSHKSLAMLAWIHKLGARNR